MNSEQLVTVFSTQELRVIKGNLQELRSIIKKKGKLPHPAQRWHMELLAAGQEGDQRFMTIQKCISSWQKKSTKDDWTQSHASSGLVLLSGLFIRLYQVQAYELGGYLVGVIIAIFLTLPSALYNYRNTMKEGIFLRVCIWECLLSLASLV